ncbi:hypothetical protein SAMN05192541_15610 [Bradyrhizobium arachidis]|nr:hypothetical protein SAMN05192541_15610 [Bradyrhizobium arachidis]
MPPGWLEMARSAAGRGDMQTFRLGTFANGGNFTPVLPYPWAASDDNK